MRLKKNSVLDRTCYEENKWEDPKSWFYIAKNPDLVKFSEGLTENQLEDFNDLLLIITEAGEEIKTAKYKDGVLSGVRNLMYLINHPEVLSKCKSALRRKKGLINPF